MAKKREYIVSNKLYVDENGNARWGVFQFVNGEYTPLALASSRKEAEALKKDFEAKALEKKQFRDDDFYLHPQSIKDNIYVALMHFVGEMSKEDFELDPENIIDGLVYEIWHRLYWFSGLAERNTTNDKYCFYPDEEGSLDFVFEKIMPRKKPKLTLVHSSPDP